MSSSNPIKTPQGGPKRTHSQTLEGYPAQPSTSPPRVRTRPNPPALNPSSAGSPLTANASPSTTGCIGTPSNGGPANHNSRWARLRGYRQGLTSRLGTVVEELVGCLEIHENALAARRDYEALRADLEGSLSTLNTHFSGDAPPTMTAAMDNLCTAISNELDGIREKEKRGVGKRHLYAKKDIGEVVECYRRVHEHMKRLTLNADLSTWRIVDEQARENRLKGLAPSLSACYDSAEATLVHRRECTPETRKQVLADLSLWRYDRQQSSLYWMNGMAGTGKTTIANSLCVMLDQSHELGASFFCTRQLPECRNVKFILPTIAYQLARFSRPFRCALSRALERDPDLHTKVLAKQFEGLFINPLREVMHTLPTDLVVVIDALDECDDRAGVSQLLAILAKNAPELPLKVFVSSRPESQIRQKIDGAGAQLILHELEKSIVKGDIEIYLRTELEHMVLSDDQLAALVECAGVLFIYAATVVRYIGESHFSLNPKKRLAKVLETQTPGQSKKHQWIDQLYSLILASVFDDPELEDWDRDQRKLVLHTVVCAQEPLTMNALAGLFQWDNIDLVNHALQPLWSVLHVSGSTNLVNTLHTSFPDYMLDPSRSKHYGCDGKKHHAELSKICLRRIEGNERQFNLCELESSFLPDNEVPGLEDKILRVIPLDLLYACQYWGIHLHFAGWSAEGAKLLEDFLSTRLLLWMEVLNLTSQMRAGILSLEKSKSWCKATECPASLRELVHGAWKFTTIFATNSVSRSTPHIYISMLASSPALQPLTTHYYRRASGLIKFGGPGMTNRQLALLNTYSTCCWVKSVTFSPDSNSIAFGSGESIYMLDAQSGCVSLGPLQIHDNSVNSVAFSPNGTRIASGSSDGTICIWNAQNGELLQGPLLQADGVTSVSFSPNGKSLVSGSSGGSINIWDAELGEQVLGLLGAHTDNVTSVSFSPDGTRIVSGSYDGTVCVWDPKNLAICLRLDLMQHLGPLNSVAFSPNSRYIGFGTWQGDICMWDTLNGQALFGPLRDEGGAAIVVAFSPDGKYIASGNDMGLISLRDSMNGERVLGPLQGHQSLIRSIAFSPDATRIVSGSEDGTISIWDAYFRHEAMGSFEEQSSGVENIAASPDGKYVASAYTHSAIRVWGLRNGQRTLNLSEEHRDASSVAFSHDGLVVASGHQDGTTRLWDAQKGGILGEFEGSGGFVRSVAFSPDSAYIASGSDCSIMVWDIRSQESIIGPLHGHSDRISCVAFLADGAHFVSGSDDNTIRIWDTQHGKQAPRPLKGYTGGVNSIACSPKGRHIVSGTDRGVCLWDAQSQRLLRTFIGHTRTIWSVTFSPDGTYAASASSDKTIIVWDVESGEMVLGPLEGHTDFITSVVFSSDGTNLNAISGSRDGAIRVWPVPPRKSPTPEIPAATSLPFHLSDNPALSQPGKLLKSAHSSWFIEDGWVTDPEGRLLVWVPPDLRSRLLVPENTMLLAHNGFVSLNFENANIGELWRDCYVPA